MRNDERQTIARTHEEVGRTLSEIKRELSAAEGALRLDLLPSSTDVVDHLKAAMRLIDVSVATLQRASTTIRPAVAGPVAAPHDGNGAGRTSRGLPHERLSDREYQVLRLLGVGKTVSQIADELALSVKTVSTYRARILEKMRLRTTPELIHYVIDHGLAP